MNEWQKLGERGLPASPRSTLGSAQDIGSVFREIAIVEIGLAGTSTWV